MISRDLRLINTCPLLLCLTAGVASAGGDKASFSLLNPTPMSAMRDMSTDRPDKTESPYTVDAGRFQIESDLVVYTRDHEDGVTTQSLDVLPFNFKVGLTHDMDVQFVYGSFSRVRVGAADFSDSEQGSGDLVIRVKRNLWGNDGGRTALGLMPFIKLPTNSLSSLNTEVEGGLIVPLAIELREGVGLGLMTEVDILRAERSGGYEPTFINSATVSFDLTKKLGLYTEIYTERSAEAGARTVVTFDAGLTYAVNDNLQLDTGVNVGLTEAADDVSVFAGISQRF